MPNFDKTSDEVELIIDLYEREKVNLISMIMDIRQILKEEPENEKAGDKIRKYVQAVIKK